MSADPSHRAKPLENLLVVRLGAMGDIIHTLPAIAALRNALPKTKIGWVVEERWAELLCAKKSTLSGPLNPARPLIDFVHVVNTKHWRKSPLAKATRQEIAAAFREIRAQRYQAAADFQGAIKSAVVARISGAQKLFGMLHPREAPARMLYQYWVDSSGTHVVEQCLSLAEAVFGSPLTITEPEFPRDDAAEASMSKKLGGIGGTFLLVNPGAGWGAKQWPAKRYVEVARALAADGHIPLINFGPGEEELANQVQRSSGGAATSISCSVAELIALTRRARLFIGGDTGPLHLAAALKIPVVAIFGPTDPARNGPYGTKSIVLRNPASRTSLSHTSDTDPGMLQITSEEVIAAARSLLRDNHA